MPETEPSPGPAEPRRRLRRRLVGALVVLTVLLTFVSTIGVWSRGVLLNTDRWVATVGPLASEEELTDALAAYLVEQAVAAIDLEAVAAEALPERAEGLAVPLTSALQGFLTDQAQALLASDAFATAIASSEAIWKSALIVGFTRSVWASVAERASTGDRVPAL